VWGGVSLSILWLLMIALLYLGVRQVGCINQIPINHDVLLKTYHLHKTHVQLDLTNICYLFIASLPHQCYLTRGYQVDFQEKYFHANLTLRGCPISRGPEVTGSGATSSRERLKSRSRAQPSHTTPPTYRRLCSQFLCILYPGNE
jgi:hypothetical protein